MKSIRLGAGAIAAIGCAISLAGSAWACGDKLVALGGGIGFERVVVSRYPGQIILVLEPVSGLEAANKRFNLEASLSLAGHEVFVARNDDELREYLTQQKPDLILVDAASTRQYEMQPAAGGTAPAVIPVNYAEGGGELPVSLQQSGCGAVDVGRKGSQLVKAVEGAMKLRSRGLPLPCDKSAPSHQT